MVKQEKTLAELTEGLTLLPQTLINIKTEHAAKLLEDQRVQASVRALSEKLGNEGRVLLRPSGTEPLLRVMVEGLNQDEVIVQAEHLRDNIVTIEQTLH